jgi:DNA-binding LacI/PurR family transcriptional regulator
VKKNAKVTIKQIADLTGVSVATVSRVMNHKAAVTEHTRQKILDAMAQLNVNPSSVFLTDHTSRTILLCVPDFINPFNSLIFEGIHRSAYRNHYRVFMLQSKELYLTFEDCEDILKNHSFAGIILLTSVIDTQVLETLSRSYPIVMCSEYCDLNGISFVSIDNVTAARKAAEYLISCGCKKIALLNSDLRKRYARQREQGYAEALRKAGLEIRDEWVAHISSIDYALAFSYASNILNQPERPDAFFAVSDVFAVGALHASRKLGLRVPEDIAVIGFDNVEVSSMTDPAITTIAQPSAQIGYQSCELLIERINKPSATRKQIILDTELIVRESTPRSLS